MTTIEEVRNLKTLKLDELVGFLLTYEMTLKHDNKRDDARRGETKKKEIALKSFLKEKEKREKEKSEEDEDIAILVKRFRKFMRRNYRGRRHLRRDAPEGEHRKYHLICYDCRKPRHTKYDCPNGKKSHLKNVKKKAMMTTWSDIDDSQDEEGEVANFCFMTFEEPKICSSLVFIFIHIR